MKVQVHNIAADCPACRGTDFDPAGGKLEAFGSQTMMVCAQCGARTSYIQLLMQIGDKAVQRSTETLERIRSQRRMIGAKEEPKN